LRSAGPEFWPTVVVEGMVLNLHHMPWDQDRFHHTLREGMDAWFMETDSSSPMLLEALPRLLWDDQEELLQPGIADKVWSELVGDNLWALKGGQINSGRFLNSVHAAKHVDKIWARRELQYKVNLLKAGTLFTARLQSLKNKVKVRDTVDAPRENRAMNAMDDVKELCAKAKNAVETAYAFFSDPEKRILCRIIGTVFTPTLNWHQVQNVQNRNADLSRAWLVDQAKGRFFADLIMPTVKVLYDERALYYMGLITSDKDYPADAERDLAHPAMQLQDRRAQRVGSLVQHAVLWHLRRFTELYRGVRSRVTLMGADNEELSRAAALAIRREWRSFRRMKAMRN